MRKELLIVGGNGFIGSHLTELALEKGYRTTVITLNQKPFSIPIAATDQIQILHIDATNLKNLKKAFQDRAFHYVVNAAGFIDHTLYKDGGRQLIDQHFTVVMNLVECLSRKGLEGFLQIGSSDEYGNLPAPQLESSREAPISPYSLGKVAATHFLQMLHNTEQFPASIVRVFLTYGPGQNNQRFLPQVIQGCLQGRSFPVSQGEQLRDFCYIKDIVAGIFQVLENPATRGEVINLASGKGITIRKVIETVCQLIGKGNPLFGEIPYRPKENMCLYANVEKAYQLSGWEPETSLENGLRETIQYYQEQLNHDLLYTSC